MQKYGRLTWMIYVGLEPSTTDEAIWTSGEMIHKRKQSPDAVNQLQDTSCDVDARYFKMMEFKCFQLQKKRQTQNIFHF